MDARRIVDLFVERGDEEYHGESVSQSAHALQAAHLAESEGADDALVVAALLHDIGHLLHDLGEDAAERGIDDYHENSGAHWLARHFGPEVSEPVRLHVAAKRYLCAVDPSYHDGLSPASRLSLELQGGPMSAEEVATFEAHPSCSRAVRLRRWDDAAKVVDRVVPGLEHYLGRIESLLTTGSDPAGAASSD